MIRIWVAGEQGGLSDERLRPGAAIVSARRLYRSRWEPISEPLRLDSNFSIAALSSTVLSQGVDAQRRPCRLELGTAAELIDWIAEQKRRWEGRLDALEAHLEQVQTEESNE
jgi:hypothetical protein